MTTVSREALERAVLGALKSCIKDHGPITADKLTSATKRVLGNLRNAGVQLGEERLAGPDADQAKGRRV